MLEYNREISIVKVDTRLAIVYALAPTRWTEGLASGRIVLEVVAVRAGLAVPYITCSTGGTTSGTCYTFSISVFVVAGITFTSIWVS